MKTSSETTVFWAFFKTVFWALLLRTWDLGRQKINLPPSFSPTTYSASSSYNPKSARPRPLNRNVGCTPFFLTSRCRPRNCVGGVMRRLLRFSKTGASRPTHPDRCLMSSPWPRRGKHKQTKRVSCVAKGGALPVRPHTKRRQEGFPPPHHSPPDTHKRLLKDNGRLARLLGRCVSSRPTCPCPCPKRPCPGSRQPIFRPPRRPLISYTLHTTRHVVPVDVCQRLALFWGTAGRRGDKTDSLLSLPASCLLGAAPRWRWRKVKNKTRGCQAANLRAIRTHDAAPLLCACVVSTSGCLTALLALNRIIIKQLPPPPERASLLYAYASVSGRASSLLQLVSASLLYHCVCLRGAVKPSHTPHKERETSYPILTI